MEPRWAALWNRGGFARGHLPGLQPLLPKAPPKMTPHAVAAKISGGGSGGRGAAVRAAAVAEAVRGRVPYVNNSKGSAAPNSAPPIVRAPPPQ